LQFPCATLVAGLGQASLVLLSVGLQAPLSSHHSSTTLGGKGLSMPPEIPTLLNAHIGCNDNNFIYNSFKTGIQYNTI